VQTFRILTVLACVASAPTVWAAESIKFNQVGAYESNKGDVAVRLYLYAAGQAYMVYNTAVTQKGLKPLFCPPKSLSMNEGNYVSVFEKALPKARLVFGPRLPRVPMEIVLLDGLQSTFPCD
jgi:hypothetical protein